MTTGGTVNYTDGFKRSGGANPALVRDGRFVDKITVGSTSAINKQSGKPVLYVLADASSVTGNEDSYYVIRGFTIGTIKAAANTFQGMAYETHTGHAGNTGALQLNDADGGVFSFGLTKFQPTNVTFPQPIKLSNGNGLNVECYNLSQAAAQTGNTITVFYNLIENN